VKLLTVSPYFESHRGGVEIVAGRLGRELARRDVEVRWIATDASPPPEAPPSTPIRAWNFAERRLGIPYPLPSPGAARAIGRAVSQADAVLVHDALYATSVLSVLAARRRGKPVLLVQHIGQIPYRGFIPRTLMAIANAIVARSLLRRVDQVVFISDVAARYFADVRFRRPPAMIFNGVDAAVFRPADALERAGMRRELGLADARPQALFVGRFVEKKGLRHMQRLAALRPDVDFNFAGWGQLDPETWGAANVRVFRGLSGASLARLYQACDVLVLPSVGEGYPLVVQEALACGLAVVCGEEVTRADPAAAPYLRGAPIDDDPGATAAALSQALDGALADAGSKAERASFALGRYAWETAAQRYIELLEALMATPSERAAQNERRADLNHAAAS